MECCADAKSGSRGLQHLLEWRRVTPAHRRGMSYSVGGPHTCAGHREAGWLGAGYGRGRGGVEEEGNSGGGVEV